MERIPRTQKGQTAVVFTLAIVTVVGAMALSIDVAMMYFNWTLLQKGVDSAALAGANFLPSDPATARTTAINYAKANGITQAEITSTTVSPDDQQITVEASRTVPYYFGRVLGLDNQLISVSATAAVPYAPSTIGGAYTGTPSPGNGGSTFTGYYGSSPGDYGLVPIGLDYNTPYVNGQSITLHQGQLGPGNWDTIELGSPGGSTLRSNIANGYSGPISVNDWVNTEPGQKVGPVVQGFQDRINAALSSDPTGTFDSHSYNDPRILFVPLVDWNTPAGRTGVQVMGFAALWIDSTSGSSDLNVHFISQVAPESLPNTDAPYAGVRGAPVLIK